MTKIDINNCKHYIPFFIGGLVIVIYMIPYLVLNKESYFTINDYLDFTIGHIKNILQNGLLFSFDSNVPLMDGITRSEISYTSPLDIKTWFFVFMPTYWAIIANIFFVKLLAFIGMFLFLSENVLKNNMSVAVIVSLIFCFIPFYEDYGLSSAGIPLLLYSLVNLYKGKKVIRSYLIVLLFALYSSLALSGLFVCIFLFVVLSYILLENKYIHRKLTIALIIMSCIYLVGNWSTLTNFLFENSFVSHRIEWPRPQIDAIADLMIKTVKVWMLSQMHAGSFVALPIVCVFLFVYFKYKKVDSTLSIYLKCLLLLFILIFAGSLLKILPIGLFTTFQFDRFYFIYPALCIILLAKSCQILLVCKKYKIIVFSVILSFICVAVTNKDYCFNLIRLANKTINASSYSELNIMGKRASLLSFSQFYDEKVFNKIADDLNLQQNYSIKVVSVGLYPSVAEYNGFWCLDGYMTTYPIEYKHRFRRVIEEELQKSNTTKSYFDNWGSRCYILSSELGNHFLFSKNDDNVVKHLDIDTKALKGLGCQYIFSAVEIGNYRDLNLDYINSYTSSDSYYNIRVYKL